MRIDVRSALCGASAMMGGIYVYVGFATGDSMWLWLSGLAFVSALLFTVEKNTDNK